MKLFNKILTVILLLLTSCGIFVLCFRNPSGVSPAHLPATDMAEKLRFIEKNSSSVPVKHFSSDPELFSAGTVPEYTPSDISGKIISCAREMLCAILPENAVISQEHRIKLIGSDHAEVSGIVTLPGNTSSREKKLKYTINVYFPPSGSCEAAFPEFANAK